MSDELFHGFSGITDLWNTVLSQKDRSESPLTDLHHSLLLEEPIASGSGALARMGEWDGSLLTPVCSSLICPTQLQIPSSSLTPSPTCTTDESHPKAQLKTDEACVKNTSAWPDHCKVGSWWKQDIETCRASSGLSSLKFLNVFFMCN